MSTFCDILCVRLAALRKRLLLVEDAELIDDVIRELRAQRRCHSEGERMRRACDQCLGTDTQRECERGECYAEHYQRQQEERWREEGERRHEAEDEQ